MTRQCLGPLVKWIYIEIRLRQSLVVMLNHSLAGLEGIQSVVLVPALAVRCKLSQTSVASPRTG